MEDNFVNIFEKPYQSFKAMSRQELEAELDQWRNLWTWHEEVLQYWLTKVRSPIIVKLRNYARIEGLLGQPHFELKSIDIDNVERIYNYSKGEATYETKTTTIGLGQLIDIEFVHNKEVIQEQFSGEPLKEALETANSELS